MILTGVILPILFIILLGWLLRRFGGRFEHAFSRTQLYILGPALLFSTMARSGAGFGTILTVLLYVVVLSAVLLAATQALGLAAGGGRQVRNAMSLAGTFTNSGFYGIPVCMLAFGEAGLVWAAVYMTASATFQATMGVFIASAGTRSAAQAALTVVKVPLIWAIVAGRLLADAGLLPPEPFMQMIDLLGRSAIPLGLLLLGMQLERIVSERGDGVTAAERGPGGSYAAPGSGRALGAAAAAPRPAPAAAATPAPAAPSYDQDFSPRRIAVLGIASGTIKVFGGLAAALVILRLFDFEPLLRNVILVQSSMPTAVNAVVYATEFDCRPRLVAVGILTSTLISVASISLILGYLV